jgi:hypothetical protein
MTSTPTDRHDDAPSRRGRRPIRRAGVIASVLVVVAAAGTAIALGVPHHGSPAPATSHRPTAPPLISTLPTTRDICTIAKDTLPSIVQEASKYNRSSAQDRFLLEKQHQICIWGSSPDNRDPEDLYVEAEVEYTRAAEDNTIGGPRTDPSMVRIPGVGEEAAIYPGDTGGPVDDHPTSIELNSAYKDVALTVIIGGAGYAGPLADWRKNLHSPDYPDATLRREAIAVINAIIADLATTNDRAG